MADSGERVQPEVRCGLAPVPKPSSTTGRYAPAVAHHTDGAIERTIAGRTLALLQGDITQVPADAIGNAANDALAGGGGVDGAIHRAGGPSIIAELRERYGRTGCPTGQAVVTGAGKMPARWVVHAVGPVWYGGHRGEPELLASAFRSAVARADEVGARSLTLPAISTGIYGYPRDGAARIGVQTVAETLPATRSLERVTFVLFSRDAFDVFSAALDEVVPAS